MTDEPISSAAQSPRVANNGAGEGAAPFEATTMTAPTVERDYGLIWEGERPAIAKAYVAAQKSMEAIKKAGYELGTDVALALDVDAGVGGALAQGPLLAVLVVADRRAAQRTDTGADHRTLATLGGIATAEQARGHADGGADQRALAGLVLLLGLVAVRVLLHVRATGGTGREDGSCHQTKGNIADSGNGAHQSLLHGPAGRPAWICRARINSRLRRGDDGTAPEAGSIHLTV